MTGLAAQPIAVGALAGCAVGLVYFAALWQAVRCHAGGSATGLAVALHLARFAVLGLAFWVMAGYGAAALLAGLAGLIVARQISLALVRSGRC